MAIATLFTICNRLRNATVYQEKNRETRKSQRYQLLTKVWSNRNSYYTIGGRILENDLSLSEKVNLSMIYVQAIPRQGFGSNTSLACVHQETKGAHRHPGHNSRKTETWKQARCASIIK